MGQDSSDTAGLRVSQAAGIFMHSDHLQGPWETVPSKRETIQSAAVVCRKKALPMSGVRGQKGQT